MGSKFVVLAICVLSLLSWPTVMFVSRLNIIKSEVSATAVGLAFTAAALLLTILLFRRYFKRVDPFIYVFSLLCYDALPGLVFILEVDGYIPSNNSTTLVTGIEPFMRTAHGAVTSYYNGIIHFGLCLAAIILYVRRDSHREVTLYWAGSTLNMLVVLIPGLLTQKLTDYSAVYLNGPFIILPILAIGYYMHRRPVQARSFLEAPKIWQRPVGFFFFLYFLAASVLVCFRGLAVLGGNASCMKQYLKDYEPYLTDANNYPKFQTLAYLYFFLAYYLSAMFGLVYPGQHWMTDWALVHAGAATQSQVSYIAGALNHRTRASMRPSFQGPNAAIFWSINCLLFLLPNLFALWCLRNPDDHGRTYTVDLAAPKYTVDGIVRRPARRYHKKEDHKDE